MSLEFQRGDPDNPVGHAILYFISAEDGESVLATYLVVPPIKIELAKYMPPMFASNVSFSDVDSVSAIPLPPMPEPVGSVPLPGGSGRLPWRRSDLRGFGECF